MNKKCIVRYFNTAGSRENDLGLGGCDRLDKTENLQGQNGLTWAYQH